MGVFFYAQGQLTLLSVIQFGKILNTSRILSISSLSARHSRAANSVISGLIWQKFTVIQALWLSLLPARMKKINSKMQVLECSQHLSHCKSKGIFRMLKGSQIHCQNEHLWLSWSPAIMEIQSKMCLVQFCPCCQV